MTATTTTLGTGLTKRIQDRLRRAAVGVRALASAIGARWRAEVAAGNFGPDAEAIIGRGTGARV
jgi:hypothetical protein